MSKNTLKSGGKLKLTADRTVSLAEIVKSFHSAISEEHAWALCYQCSKFFIDNLRKSAASAYLVSDLQHVFLQLDGTVHPSTFYVKLPESENRKPLTNQLELINGLGCTIYNALDHGSNGDEAAAVSSDLEALINDMILDEQVHQETDDEGIERDSWDPDESETGAKHVSHMTLHKVVERCEKHLLNVSKSEVESHYQAVVKALITEAIELTTFLESVASGGLNRNGESATDLEHLQFADWARFWVQVIAELRQGFSLKKVHYTKTPIEYELTPYEILMKDIRSRRYTLKKVSNDDLPNVNKDAREIILEFIRSRPPLKKASERKLPPRQITYTLREQLMHSIRKGRKLRKTKMLTSPSKKHHLRHPNVSETSSTSSCGRLIKIDLTKLDYDDDDDDDDESDSSESCHLMNEPGLEAYDLAYETPCTSRRYSLNVCTLDPEMSSQSLPHSRPGSRQSCASSDTLDSVQLPLEIKKALEDNSKPWHEAVSLEGRLSLTLEEIVHIRIVLAKAEFEALPIDGQVRYDVENRNICFHCLKTRFGFLRSKGNRCALCKTTVCTKCCSKMNIPMEHFSNVPVVLLSPSIICTPEEEYTKVMNKSSGNSSPQQSPNSSRPSSSLERFRSRNSAQSKAKRSSQLLVCHDCRMMVLKIIESGQANRSAIRNKHLQHLTLNLEPVFPVT